MTKQEKSLRCTIDELIRVRAAFNVFVESSDYDEMSAEMLARLAFHEELTQYFENKLDNLINKNSNEIS